MIDWYTEDMVAGDDSQLCCLIFIFDWMQQQQIVEWTIYSMWCKWYVGATLRLVLASTNEFEFIDFAANWNWICLKWFSFFPFLISLLCWWWMNEWYWIGNADAWSNQIKCSICHRPISNGIGMNWFEFEL